MARSHTPRRGRLTPNLKLSEEHLHIERSHTKSANGQASPPETPTASPHIARKPHPAALFRYSHSRPLARDPNIKPVGNGHQFSYQRVFGPEQLSPRSSSSSSDAKADSDDDGCSVSAAVPPRSLANSAVAEFSDDEGLEQPGVESEPESDLEDGSAEVELDGIDGDSEDNGEGNAGDDLEEDVVRVSFGFNSEPGSQTGSATDTDTQDAVSELELADGTVRHILLGDFVIEDIDPMDSGCEGLDVLLPTEIESNRSRSRSRHKESHRRMVRDFKKLNCSNETSENDNEGADIGFDEETLFRKRQREMRRMRRVSMSSSYGKRTHSELSDSDESETGALDVNDVGSSARRMRKRLHRTSLLFQDPPAPRIDELDEPDSSEDDIATADPLARELPYWTMEIMEVEPH